MPTPEVLHLTATDVASTLSYTQAINIIRTTLTRGFNPETDPARIDSPIPQGTGQKNTAHVGQGAQGNSDHHSQETSAQQTPTEPAPTAQATQEPQTPEVLLMPSTVGDFTGIKILTVTPDNPTRNAPVIQGMCLLLDATTHRPLATIDGTALTTLRTPAVSLAGISTHLTHRFPYGVRMVVIGNGAQALPHVVAAASITRISHLTVVVRTPGRAAHVLAGAKRLGIPSAEVVAATPESHLALEQAGLVVTVTAATEPVLHARDINERACVVAVGSHSPEARELPGELLGHASVIVESMATARTECGDTIQAVHESHLTWDDVHVMRDVLNAGTLPEGKPIVFKTAGMAWEDIAVAGAIYREYVKEHPAT